VINREILEYALKGQDCLVHLAAETGTGQSMYEIRQYVNVNIDGTAIMLDVLANCTHDVKKVIVASSRAIYGEGKYDCSQCGGVYPDARSDGDMEQNKFDCKCSHCRGNIKLVATSENSKIHPTSVYGITKQMQEQLVMTVCPTIGINSVAFRYQNVYGPGQSLSNPYTGILSIFSTRIKNGNEVNIFEDGRESRDFIYIDDVVDATILGIEKEEANGHVFNVGTGIATDVITVAKTLMRKYDTKVPLRISGNYRLGDIRHNFADISLAKQILGFKPKWDFNKGISEFVKWVNGQDIQEDKYELSIKEMQEKGLYK
jgi:dTDP-L-rhamnose 4-epimerase